MSHETVSRLIAETENRHKRMAAEPAASEESPTRLVHRLARLGEFDAIVSSLVIRPEDPLEKRLAIGLERVIGANNILDADFLFQGAEISKAVVRVNVIEPGRSRVAAHGTGWMVSPRLMITNNHVLPSIEHANGSFIEFGFRRIAGRIQAPMNSRLDPAEFFFTDTGRDFTIVATQKPWGHIIPLIAESGKAVIGERVNIIHHPQGEPQRVTLHENRITGWIDEFIHYETDTQPGSSGAPVLNNQWEAVALHHSGVPARGPDGDILDVNGLRWTGHSPIKWIANEGVRISEIVAAVRNANLDAQRLAQFDEAVID